MEKVTYITKEGLERLKLELKQLTGVERPSISKQIAEARDKGDLSENAEYDAAKEAQGLLEMKIAQLQSIVVSSRIIDESQVTVDIVSLLNKVKIKNLKNDAIMEYTIVSESEANLKEKKISIGTPIAEGLLGKKVGDIVDITVPSGILKFEIVSISV